MNLEGFITFVPISFVLAILTGYFAHQTWRLWTSKTSINEKLFDDIRNIDIFAKSAFTGFIIFIVLLAIFIQLTNSTAVESDSFSELTTAINVFAFAIFFSIYLIIIISKTNKSTTPWIFFVLLVLAVILLVHGTQTIQKNVFWRQSVTLTNNPQQIHFFISNDTQFEKLATKIELFCNGTEQPDLFFLNNCDELPKILPANTITKISCGTTIKDEYQNCEFVRYTLNGFELSKRHILDPNLFETFKP